MDNHVAIQEIQTPDKSDAGRVMDFSFLIFHF